MGCGTSKGDVIKSNDKDKPTANGGNSASNSVTSEASTIVVTDDYRHQNGNGTIKGTLPPLKPPRSTKVGPDANSNESNNKEGPLAPSPIAFEVPSEDGEDLIKRHPPKRLIRQLEAESEVPSLTQEALEEKVQQANIRRTQVLTQRIASARTKSARGQRTIHRPMVSGQVNTSADISEEDQGRADYI